MSIATRPGQVAWACPECRTRHELPGDYVEPNCGHRLAARAKIVRLVRTPGPPPGRGGDAHVQEKGYRLTALGTALYVRVFTNDYRPLSWSEVWAAFARSYPGQWAVQCFPPASDLLDEENVYHLFVLDEPPRGLNIHPNAKERGSA